MAEKKEMHLTNIKLVSELFSSGKLTELENSSVSIEKSVKTLKSVLEEKFAEYKAAAEETERAIETAESAEPEATPVETVSPEIEKAAPEKKEPEKEAEPIKEEKAAEEKTPEKKETESEAKPAPATEEKKEEKAEEKKPATKPLPSYIVRRNEFVPESKPERPARKEFRPAANGAGGFNRPKPDFKPGFKKPQGQTYVAPAVIPGADKRGAAKKKTSGEKSYEEKHSLNKRALIRNNVDIDDFDENKTGYRKFRPVKKAKDKQESGAIKIEKAVINTEIIPLKVLSEKIGITAAEITKRLFKEGIMKTINDSIDFDTAAFIADDVGVELELKLDKTAEDALKEGYGEEAVDPAKLVTRSPVVTVMGHVDHGKTSILDRIRKTNVTAGEAGGITQHIGAYQVSFGKSSITFLDTPGHAAFTAMRARGAEVTDIAVLVVAADDGIMPQTVEAINHAKAANVPIIVAVNKIDKPEANIERVKTQLTDNGLLPEEWGGDAIICPVSAKTGEGIDNLLASINLVAEMKELKADPTRKAKGVVIEAKLDQSKGPIATILVQNGTLRVADSVIVGTVTGKIRAMVDDKGRRVASAGPSTPVSVMGLDEVPNAGDILFAAPEEKLLKLVAEERKNKERENMIKSAGKVTLDDVFNRIAEGEVKGLNLIVKADVQGSVEAVKQSLEKLSNDEVKVNVIHAAVGAIKESDIMLAESSNAIIIGFNVRPDANARQIAERSGVDVKLYRVIYEAIEDVEKALKGMLAPKFTEVYLGKAEVREVFKISGVGQVAGCYVTEGKILRSGKLRIYRDDVMICEGNVLQLKRFKDDVKEVAQGYECGISIEKFNDIKVGDFIESYQVEENKE
ncbi:MAG TPA: translation initiation factor IF-2 [Clostridiales bacterium]|nr:translation initiation factor IF-2 [Clostridiales bacterium]